MAENFVSNLLIPELLCADFNKSLNFYTEILGFQIRYDLYESVKKANARIYLPLKEEWYQANEIMLGCLQFIVFDIDGYMLRFSQDIGTKPI
ncbi:hypothetical protein SOV_33340 [Sporomusa ovata DSM 2662]|uniref:hypothetical protein n=1 Tax=Sporomusa ovata TaxID=2378 RepID=UPI0003884D27|nr:hypothetical protein [Sporomusa ovata]EQB25269.1 hypothetical protein SOV_5c04370 [Sporomusa ovata DSM 2662]